MSSNLVLVWYLLVAIGTAAGQGKLSDRGYIEAETDLDDVEDQNATEYYYHWNEDDIDVWRWNVQEFPNPKTEPRHCQRMKSSNLCDPDQILTRGQAESLDALILSVFNETPCICDKCIPSTDGVQIGIALMKNIYLPYNERYAKSIQSFAKNLRAKWNLGACNDDILIVIVTQDRLSYTDIGPATARYIPQDEGYRIFIENIAHFSAKRYYDGLRAMLTEYSKLSQTIPKDKPPEEISVSKITGIIIGALLLLAIVALAIIWVYKRWKRKGSDTSSEKSGDIISSTWRKKMPLRPQDISQPDSYKPCKTVDDVISDDEDNRCVEVIHQQSPEQETPSTDVTPEKPAIDNVTSTEVTSSGTNDGSENLSPPIVNEATYAVPFTTFLPKKPTELHHTDL